MTKLIVNRTTRPRTPPRWYQIVIALLLGIIAGLALSAVYS